MMSVIHGRNHACLEFVQEQTLSGRQNRTANMLWLRDRSTVFLSPASVSGYCPPLLILAALLLKHSEQS